MDPLSNSPDVVLPANQRLNLLPQIHLSFDPCLFHGCPKALRGGGFAKENNGKPRIFRRISLLVPKATPLSSCSFQAVVGAHPASRARAEGKAPARELCMTQALGLTSGRFLSKKPSLTGKTNSRKLCCRPKWCHQKGTMWVRYGKIMWNLFLWILETHGGLLCSPTMFWRVFSIP